ncbi:NAD(P)H-hydrate epimerase [Candida viswanathii]|uniref:NAD(P)H-hydrate epimerase n=1 Tax=Candida viswanathii TaxID=5486 RepID=A0A367XTH7_9ASCO|nr:NAD(P)H-hydrate epimerase [Candida viswanathii]
MKKKKSPVHKRKHKGAPYEPSTKPFWFIFTALYLFGCVLIFFSAIGLPLDIIEIPNFNFKFNFTTYTPVDLIMSRPLFKTLSAKSAFQLDQELMSSGEFSIDQLMEIAGLAVAQVVHKEFQPPPPPATSKVLVLVGPGNNGGDGLVAARHLKLWGSYDPVIYYPKKSTSNPLYGRLVKQLQDLDVTELSTLDEVKHLLDRRNSGVALIIDSLFGFSFKPPLRPPFDDLIGYLSSNNESLPPIVAVDIPSGWDVDDGPAGVDIGASVLVSLTAPKPAALKFTGSHYLGGRFINPHIAEKYDIGDVIAKYKGDEMVVKL